MLMLMSGAGLVAGMETERVRVRGGLLRGEESGEPDTVEADAADAADAAPTDGRDTLAAIAIAALAAAAEPAALKPLAGAPAPTTGVPEPEAAAEARPLWPPA